MTPRGERTGAPLVALAPALLLVLTMGGRRSATTPTTIQRADMTFEPTVRASWPEGAGPVAAGLLQGAVFRFGAGRVAVFGEAAMFSAQEQIAGELDG